MALPNQKPADTSSTLANMVKQLESQEQTTLLLRQGIQRQQELAAKLDEDRRRENEQYEYTLQVARRAELDRQAAEDKLRDEGHAKRNNDMREREDELCQLLGCPFDTNAINHRKTVQAAFNAKVAQIEKASEGKAKGMADKENAAANALIATKHESALALVKQENAQLAKQVAELTAQNTKLLAAQGDSVAGMKELAAKGFEAAGAIGTRGMGALETAAQGGLGTQPRGRG